MESNVVIRSEVVETNFGFYSDEEKKCILSACKVSSMEHEDVNGNTIEKYVLLCIYLILEVNS